MFGCRNVDNIIAKSTKPPKDDKKLQKPIRFSERGHPALQKEYFRTVIMIKTKRYMHLWHICMVMIKVLVEILVTVCN